ncbi:hypothetical protein OROGR_018426 [Orobanche gracilis]
MEHINGLAADEESTVVLSEPLLLRRSGSNTTSQIAIVGSNPGPIESLDYEIIENDFFKQDWRSRGKIEIFQYIFLKWILCFVVGLILSLVGFFNNLAIENIAGMKFVITSNMMLARKFAVAFTVFASSNLGLTLLASLITAFIAPEAAGSGIPEVKAYLNGVDAPAIFSLRTLLVKFAPGEMATKHLGVRLDETESTACAIQSEIAKLRGMLQASIDSTHAQNDRIDAMMKRFEEMMQSRSVLTKSCVFDASSSGGNFNGNFDRNVSDSGSGNPVSYLDLDSSTNRKDFYGSSGNGSRSSTQAEIEREIGVEREREEIEQDKFNKSASSVTGEREIQRKNEQLVNSGNLEKSRSCSNGTIQEQLLEIKQSKSVEEYCNRLISFAASLGGDSEEIKLREFVNGFETVVRVELRLWSPTCLEEAIQFAVKIEEHDRDLMRLRLGRDWAYQKAQNVAQIVVVESSSQGPRIFKIKPMLEKFTVSSVNRVEENEEAELVLALDSFKKSAPASSIRTEGGGGREIPYKEKSGQGSIKNRTILESWLLKRSSGNRVAVDLNEGAVDLDSFVSDILSNTLKASDNESITVDSDNWDFNAKNKERPIFKGAQESTGRKGRSCPWWVEMISGKRKMTMPFDGGRTYLTFGD